MREHARLGELIVHLQTLKHIIFVDLAIISIGYDNTVLPKVIANLGTLRNHSIKGSIRATLQVVNKPV